MRPVCPKCRAEGLDTDCADRLTPKGRRLSDEQPYYYEVTFTFPVTPPPTDDIADPIEHANRQRERWLEDPATLINLLVDAAIDEDFQFRVTPIFGS